MPRHKSSTPEIVAVIDLLELK